jgi:hypothetical protein
MNRPSIIVHASESAALAAALRQRGKVRIELATVWKLWAAAAPRFVGHPDQIEGLAGALRELAGQGVITLPVDAWDRTTVPPLPDWVRCPDAVRKPRDRPWTRFPWRVEMGWAASLKDLSEERFADLTAVNDWLVRKARTSVPVVPARYRSVELFGDEKRLDGLARTSLFGAGRLSFDLLRCARIPAPLPAAAIGAGPDLLVVENSDPYWVAVEALGGIGGHSVGVVAWGLGRVFPTQIPALAVDVAGRGPATGTIWYWGDYDPPGVTTAVEAGAVGAALGLRIRPAEHLWAAMADRPIQEAGSVPWPADHGRDWLSPALNERLSAIRQAQGRVAQESVPAAAIGAWVSAISANSAGRLTRPGVSGDSIP